MSDMHPVQTRYAPARVSTAISLRAYEVYSYVYGGQQALITGDCRGGFSVGELIAFLYAHSFPRDEWCVRVDEALRGMKKA